jgi:hypothetical protein
LCLDGENPPSRSFWLRLPRSEFIGVTKTGSLEKQASSGCMTRRGSWTA